MAHVPQRPQLYVCGECHVVHAGIHTEEHTFRPPEECAVCGNREFYTLENYPRHPDYE
ncbi:hypothetical protein ACFQPA_01745 [Halomarina halobia]|uniref:Small CPxCG-related zinc finger protein n=1 Tax=Halomarina halobia TaxID=3033386 RepID=A0ABD6A7S1_9EURY|nr:hypothetical protein [Halomarina sp. PSR21]